MARLPLDLFFMISTPVFESWLFIVGDQVKYEDTQLGPLTWCYLLSNYLVTEFVSKRTQCLCRSINSSLDILVLLKVGTKGTLHRTP